MKRFKKVLALVLAGVMALALLTACGETDPDQVIPDSATAQVVDAVNHMAADKGLGQVYYSVKYSAITQELLNNWAVNRNDSAAYKAEYDRIVAQLGGTKIVVGLVDRNTIPDGTTNPVNKNNASSKYESTIFGDTSTYNLADRIGVAFYKYTDTNTTYQLVCLFDEN